jgi:hypothetical protein
MRGEQAHNFRSPRTTERQMSLPVHFGLSLVRSSDMS